MSPRVGASGKSLYALVLQLHSEWLESGIWNTDGRSQQQMAVVPAMVNPLEASRNPKNRRFVDRLTEVKLDWFTTQTRCRHVVWRHFKFHFVHWQFVASQAMEKLVVAHVTCWGDRGHASPMTAQGHAMVDQPRTKFVCNSNFVMSCGNTLAQYGCQRLSCMISFLTRIPQPTFFRDTTTVKTSRTIAHSITSWPVLLLVIYIINYCCSAALGERIASLNQIRKPRRGGAGDQSVCLEFSWCPCKEGISRQGVNCLAIISIKKIPFPYCAGKEHVAL